MFNSIHLLSLGIYGIFTGTISWRYLTFKSMLLLSFRTSGIVHCTKLFAVSDVKIYAVIVIVIERYLGDI